MRLVIAAAALAAILGSAVLASAARAAAPLAPWVAGYGSWSTYAMGDVNDAIAGLESEVQRTMGLGMDMAEIRSGFGFGLEGGADVGRLAFVLGYERLTGSTDANAGDMKFEFRLPANAYIGRVEYVLPTRARVGLRVGLGAGIVSLAGAEKVTFAYRGSATNDVSGSGALLEARGTAELRAAAHLAVLGSIGYRYAKVGSPRFESGSFLEHYVPGLDVDYSGFFARAGVRVPLRP